jgi:hypothetical protein
MLFEEYERVIYILFNHLLHGVDRKVIKMKGQRFR